jgi:hypothetical protein
MAPSPQSLQLQLLAFASFVVCCFIAIVAVWGTHGSSVPDTTYVAEVVNVISTGIDPNTFQKVDAHTTEPTQVTNFQCASLSKPLAPITCVSSFLDVTSPGGVVRLTRGGYYTMTAFMLIDPSGVIVHVVQYCTLQVTAAMSSVAGFYGPSIPSGLFVFQTSVAESSGAMTLPFFYNGTLPFELPIVLTCAMKNGDTEFSQVTVSMTYERNPNIIGMS